MKVKRNQQYVSQSEALIRKPRSCRLSVPEKSLVLDLDNKGTLRAARWPPTAKLFGIPATTLFV